MCVYVKRSCLSFPLIIREGQTIKDQDKATAMAIRRQRGLHIHKEAFVDESISTLEGTATGDMLDFLSKELIRLQVKNKDDKSASTKDET